MVTLETSKLFRQLPAAELKQLAVAARELRFAPGHEIFKEGDPGDGVYVVRAGVVQISAVIATGERRVFSRVAPGDFFGEMSVLDRQPRSACALAEGEVDVLFLPRAEMVGLLTRSPELCMTLLQEISRRVREFNQQYLREVLQAERMAVLGRFASSIVHDLKNPLAIIGIAAEMACQQGATADARRTAQGRILRQIDRITSMVNDILEFTRGTPVAVALLPCNYAEFLGGLLEELRREVARKSVTIEHAPLPQVKVGLHPQRLTRVLYNLVFNAADMMPGAGKVTFRFGVTDQEVITEVADNGPGIAPEIADRLFEPFATYGKDKGTGLGLSICRRIIEEHGGKISSRNDPAGGAVFTFTLPRIP
jgi:signal transduction histidine kinase